MKGAEAILINAWMLGYKIVVKKRIPKEYRNHQLDEKLRVERTKQEARLLHRAKLVGIKCPTVLFVDRFAIGMTKIKGERPKMNKSECISAGKILAHMHKSGIIHGDFTPVNLLKNRNEIFVIDFGLGFLSSNIEDKAVDAFTMLKSIKNQNSFLVGYKKISHEYEKIMNRMEEIKKRVRYSTAKILL
ncbi:MAG: KEOPS complex kinase/ATPase Bud32 [Candidatus Micrarchaeota archaeon]